MTNEYFVHDESTIARNTLARSANVNSAFSSAQTGFDKLPTEAETKGGTINYGPDTGVANAYVVTLPYAPASYFVGLEVWSLALYDNTGASTVNVNGLGVVAIKTLDGGDPAAGGVAGIFGLRHNGTNFSIITPTPAGLAAAAAAAVSAAAALVSELAAADSEEAAAISAAAAAAAAGSGLVTSIEDKSSDYTIVADTDNGKMFICDPTSGDIDLTLPSIAAAGETERYSIMRATAANTLTMIRNGSDTINGVAGNYVVPARAGEIFVMFADDASPDNWIIIAWSQAVADEDFTTKSGSEITTSNKQRAYDIGFTAGYDADGVGEDVAVQEYGWLILTRDITFEDIQAYAETAPTGAAMIFDIKKNGTTIFSTLPEIDATGNADDTNDVISITTAVAGDRISFEITQVGSTIPGNSVMFTLQARLT